MFSVLINKYQYAYKSVVYLRFTAHSIIHNNDHPMERKTEKNFCKYKEAYFKHV